MQHLADSISNSFIVCHRGFIDPESIRPGCRDEIIKIYQQIQNYQSFAQNLAKQKAQEIFIPIQQKAIQTICKVA